MNNFYISKLGLCYFFKYQSQRTNQLLNPHFFVIEITEENLDESFGEDTMGGPEDSKTGETNADDSVENGDDTIEVQNEATDKQASDRDMDSETENKEEEETPKEEL